MAPGTTLHGIGGNRQNQAESSKQAENDEMGVPSMELRASGNLSGQRSD